MAENNTAKKAEKKAAKKNKQPKDRWFTLRGIQKEARRVVWPRWKDSDRGPGIFSTTGEVLVFTVFFALFFVLCEFGITFLLKFIGIGA